ncbi:MAG: glutamine synthetase [Gammaproteobacteria bacterium]|nr:glutamine synthetase [Gammaproteobacteria bacterium]
MQPRDVKTIADAKQIVQERNLQHIKVGAYDVDGVLRGKYMSREKFFSSLDNGFGFCDVVLGWDSKDQLYDNVRYTGWHTGYPDAPARIIADSCRELYYEENGLLFLAEFADKAEPICPRGTLRRVIERAQAMGLDPYCAFEYEFVVFRETRASVREKNFRNLTPLAPGYFGYSVLRNSVDIEIYHEILKISEAMDFPLEGLHEETGAGVLEAAIGVDRALSAADKAALFKTFTKVACQRNNLMATFMAKWSPQWPGQGGHLHMSLKNPTGKGLFHDQNAPFGMSDTMRKFVAGQLKYMPELLAMVAPTINSYTRLVPGYWAPTTATWGVENRTCALRVIPGGEKSQRVEYRVAAADANPYIILAAALASGLQGIEDDATLEAPVVGSAYTLQLPDEKRLPSALWEAAQRLKASAMARRWFGEPFVEHFAASREWEEREFRRAITDWELDRYFEII